MSVKPVAWTPGPWAVRNRYTVEQDKDRVHPQSLELGLPRSDPLTVRTTIAHCTEPTGDEGEANARLIASAPELAEALGYLVRQIEINDFKDSLGYDAHKLDAYIKAVSLLARITPK